MLLKMLVACLVVLPQTVCFANWKGLVHLHTRFSDGELTPQELDLRVKIAGVKWAVVLDHVGIKPDGSEFGINAKVKEINLKPKNVGPELVGMDNYLKTWRDLTAKTGRVYIPGVEYTFARSHLGVVNITLELHNSIITVMKDKGLSDGQKIKQILALVRNSEALPLICHPTLRMKHLQQGTKGRDFIGITDYSFPQELWKNEPVVLVEFMNHGNLDRTEHLIPYVLNEGTPEDPSVVAVAGCDFHTDSAEFAGHVFRPVGHPAKFPRAFERFTWIDEYEEKCTAQLVMEKLRAGKTYLTYGDTEISATALRRELQAYEDSEGEVCDIEVYVHKPKKTSLSIQLYRDDLLKPITGAAKPQEDSNFYAYYYDEKDLKKPHRYIVVIPGRAVAGPFYKRPLTAEEEKEAEEVKAFSELMGALGNLQVTLNRFDLEVIPSRVFEMADREVPANYQFDLARDSVAYLYVYVFNPDKGDIVEVRSSQSQDVGRYVEPKQLDKPTASKAVFKVPLRQVGDLIITVKARDVVKKVTVKVIDSRKTATQWKRVKVAKVSFEVPNHWDYNPPAARDPREGYCGVDGLNFTSVLVTTRPYPRPISVEQSQEFVPPDPFENFRLVRKILRNMGKQRWLIVDWSAMHGAGPNYGTQHWFRTVVIQPNNSSNLYMVELEGDQEIYQRQKDLIERITSSMKIE